MGEKDQVKVSQSLTQKKINSDNNVNSDKRKMQMDNMDKKDNMDKGFLMANGERLMANVNDEVTMFLGRWSD